MGRRRALFVYGMRARGFSPGCQPRVGIVRAEEDLSGKYYNILYYDHRLTDKEIERYELDDLNNEYEPSPLTKMRQLKRMTQVDLARISGVSLRTIQGYEIRGMETCNLKRAKALADALNCRIEDFL